ncbi:MAG: hypothetical protein SLAVMIC_00755 [uncultured marine phage]|uniref:Uncharacterized protein n=1 Tax=uncultured marine phage TaxID=707152 RepID=A0A8D9C9F8_9VIRU|nr:MAG: hypothetical protein SLAVMIC_00755 [uncultured marine phage]
MISSIAGNPFSLFMFFILGSILVWFLVSKTKWWRKLGVKHQENVYCLSDTQLSNAKKYYKSNQKEIRDESYYFTSKGMVKNEKRIGVKPDEINYNNPEKWETKNWVWFRTYHVRSVIDNSKTTGLEWLGIFEYKEEL